jgi:hypothetical protein
MSVAAFPDQEPARGLTCLSGYRCVDAEVLKAEVKALHSRITALKVDINDDVVRAKEAIDEKMAGFPNEYVRTVDIAPKQIETENNIKWIKALGWALMAIVGFVIVGLMGLYGPIYRESRTDITALRTVVDQMMERVGGLARQDEESKADRRSMHDEAKADRVVLYKMMDESKQDRRELRVHIESMASKIKELEARGK